MSLPLNEVHIAALFVRLVFLWRCTEAFFGKVLEFKVLHNSVVEFEPSTILVSLFDVRVVMA